VGCSFWLWCKARRCCIIPPEDPPLLNREKERVPGHNQGAVKQGEPSRGMQSDVLHSLLQQGLEGTVVVSTYGSSGLSSLRTAFVCAPCTAFEHMRTAFGKMRTAFDLEPEVSSGDELRRRSKVFREQEEPC
jgi:hypothetical protein